MDVAVNKDLSHETILRVSPSRRTLILEMQKPDGAVAHKEISPLEFYYAVNSSYYSTDHLRSGFLPENCLHISMNNKEKSFILWNPELRADVIYRDKEYLNSPIPRLVIGVRILETGRMADCSIGVIADERPLPETKMYYYPFSNVHPDGTVCSGNNMLPKYRKQTSLRNFPRYLLGLPDNDDMYDSSRNQLELEHGPLMEHLQDKTPDYYYSDILIPNGETLEDFINRR